MHKESGNSKNQGIMKEHQKIKQRYWEPFVLYHQRQWRDVVFYKESTFHEVLEVLPYSIYDEVIGEFVTFDNEFNLKINCGTISRWVQSSQVRKVGSAAG